MDQYTEKLKANPREKAGLISRVTFWWLLPLLRVGKGRDLNTEDLYEVERCDDSRRLAEKMRGCWEREQERAKAKSVPASYARALWSCFGCSYIAVGLLAAIEECVLRIMQPLMLGYLIRHIGGEPGYTEPWMGLFFTTGIMLGSLLYIFTHHPFFWGIQHIGMQCRIASCSLLYRKALRLSKAAMGNTTVGQMVNLLSNDVSRFDTSVIFLNYLWIGPLQLLIVTGLLWNMLGPSCMAGLLLLVLYIPLQSWMGQVFSRLRLATAHRTDERVRIMSEIVNAMRVIKMFAWEMPFAKLVQEARKKEIDVVMRTNYYRAVNMSLFFTSSKLVVFLALLTYVLTGNALTAEKVFVTSALINNLRLVMTLFFPFGIAMGSETLISCKRLQDFFELEEIADSSRVQRSEPPLEKCGVDIMKVKAQWSAENGGLTLDNITTSVSAGQLLAVVGPVGAGKGSLLQAVLGELPLIDGHVAVRGRVAYAPQESWVFAGTVRQNIIFGQTYNEKKYGEVIKVCGLEADMVQLPDGDATLVGERGTALSGGQKARINLARAVYMDGDVVLLDDPLSALDSAVGRQVFKRCIRGHLRRKVVILVTHQMQYLREADNILVLNEGKCDGQGSYNQLVNSGIDFASLLQDEQKDKDAATAANPANKNLMLRRGSSISRQGSMRSRSGSIRRLGDLNPLLASSVLSLTGSISSQDCFQVNKEGDPEIIPDQSPTKAELEAAQDTAAKPSSPAELRSSGSVSSRVYLKYFLNGGHWLLCFILMFSNVLTQVLFSATDYWLSYWSNGEQLRGFDSGIDEDTDFLNSTAAYTTMRPDTATVPPGYLETNTNVIIYSSLVGGLFIISLGRTILFFVMCMASSRKLHNKMFDAVIRVPIKYFDIHPIGQVFNRFTKDMGQIDELLPATLFDFITIMLNFIGIIVVIAYLNFWLLLPTFVLAIIFVFLRRFYLSTARDIKRLEGITRSPVFSHLSASLQGLTTIRAFKAEEAFIAEFDTHQNVHSSAWFLFLCTTRWFGICLDWISCLYIAIVTYSFLGMDDALGGDVGLAISSAMMLSGMFQWGVRQSAEVENQMTSVERVLEFSKLEPEAPLSTTADSKLDPNWPKSGAVQFVNVDLRYDEAKPPVLKNLNFSIKSGEKIGIVGRTGAGKSSLISCLLRLTEPSGSILLDGAATSALGLHTLRKNISVIPQDPTLFNGTFRRNLDPFNEHTDDQLWHALEEVQLKDVVQESNLGLEHMLSEGGSNLSVGQRQLVCLARAILSHNPVLLMDEATANVDPKTDELIQQTIRSKFQACTVLTVAHRLHTIVDSTRVMVMSAGQLKEFDSPHTLLQDRSSLFSQLVAQTGSSTAARLRNLAVAAHIANAVAATKSHVIETSLVKSSKENGKATNDSMDKVIPNGIGKKGTGSTCDGVKKLDTEKETSTSQKSSPSGESELVSATVGNNQIDANNSTDNTTEGFPTSTLTDAATASVESDTSDSGSCEQIDGEHTVENTKL